MKRFLTPQRTWPAGLTRLHLYLVPDLDVDARLGALIGSAREVLALHPSVAPVADQWLHTTIQSIGLPAGQIGSQARHNLTAQLRESFHGITPFTLICGSPLATSSAVLLDQDGDEPGHPLQTVLKRGRQVISGMFGPDAVESHAMPPHMSLAYGAGEDDSGAIGSQLRHQVRPSHAPMTVTQIHLVNVIQDPVLSQYRWEPVAVFDLGA